MNLFYAFIHNGQQLSKLLIGHRSTFTNYSYEEMHCSTYVLSHSVLMIKIHSILVGNLHLG